MPLATQRSLQEFFRETLEEIKDQQQEEPTNKGLVDRMGRQAELLKKALVAQDSPEQIVQECAQLSALASRIATEGDPAYPKYRWPF